MNCPGIHEKVIPLQLTKWPKTLSRRYLSCLMYLVVKCKLKIFIIHPVL